MEANVGLLRQALGLLNQVDDRGYRAPSHNIGGHVRHIVEFYQCVLDGLETGHIDYDARKRNRDIEVERTAAQAAIRDILRRLETLVAKDEDSVWVSIEDAGDELPGGRMASSISRELQFLRSHTIHHFAVMTPDLRALGIAIDGKFGVAPSTLRYLASKQEVREEQPCAR